MSIHWTKFCCRSSKTSSKTSVCSLAVFPSSFNSFTGATLCGSPFICVNATSCCNHFDCSVNQWIGFFVIGTSCLERVNDKSVFCTVFSQCWAFQLSAVITISFWVLLLLLLFWSLCFWMKTHYQKTLLCRTVFVFDWNFFLIPALSLEQFFCLPLRAKTYIEVKAILINEGTQFFTVRIFVFEISYIIYFFFFSLSTTGLLLKLFSSCFLQTKNLSCMAYQVHFSKGKLFYKDCLSSSFEIPGNSLGVIFSFFMMCQEIRQIYGWNTVIGKGSWYIIYEYYTCFFKAFFQLNMLFFHGWK